MEIIPNKIGEIKTPSIVWFTDENGDKPLVGEEVKDLQIENYKNIIYGVKNYLGLEYDDFMEMEYNKFLCYEVINDNKISKIK